MGIGWAALLAVAVAAAPAAAANSSEPRAPFFDDLGRYHRPVTTRSAEAQRYFDQGLLFLYAFNLQEAQRSFEQAARLDPQCASCFWGVGMSLGPHINLPARAERTKAARQATEKARAAAARPPRS